MATVAATGALAAQCAGGAPDAVDQFLGRLRNPNPNSTRAVWEDAQIYGAAVVQPLGGLLADPEFEVARNARRALYRIVRYSTRPGAGKETRAVESELIALLADPVPRVRIEVVWMLSELGGSRAVGPMAKLLDDPETREDARCALTRLPADRATVAIWSAFKRAPEDFKPALADSLRQRGEAVPGYPSRKLLPTAQTTVTPIAPKEK